MNLKKKVRNIHRKCTGKLNIINFILKFANKKKTAVKKNFILKDVLWNLVTKKKKPAGIQQQQPTLAQEAAFRCNRIFLVIFHGLL